MNETMNFKAIGYACDYKDFRMVILGNRKDEWTVFVELEGATTISVGKFASANEGMNAAKDYVLEFEDELE